jgi:hypothetical protein
MKTLVCILIPILTVLLSCQKQAGIPMESVSPDKQMTILLKPQRTSTLDPWTVKIILIHQADTSTVFQEFYADEVSSSTVSFEWKSNHSCMIHFKQRDGVMIDVPVRVN